MKCFLCNSKKISLLKMNTGSVNQCINCSLQFIDEKKNEDKSKYLKKYFKSRNGDSKLTKLRKIQYDLDVDHLIRNISRGNILDVGCSTGIFLNKLYKKSKFNLYGIDIDEDAIKIAKKQFNKKINFFKTNLINWNTNLKFDCIIFRGSFQFLGKDLNNHMEKISNICSNKSKIIVYSLPNSDSILYHILKDKWHLFDRFSHTLIFNRNSIMYLAKKFDYNVVECSYPYLETPYANITKDYEKLKKLIKFGKNESFPFWGNIMQVVLEKNT